MARRQGRRPPRSSACGDKKKLTQAEANDLVNILFKRDGALMNAYACPHRCRLDNGSISWHVGHKGRRKT